MWHVMLDFFVFVCVRLSVKSRCREGEMLCYVDFL